MQFILGGQAPSLFFFHAGGQLYADAALGVPEVGDDFNGGFRLIDESKDIEVFRGDVLVLKHLFFNPVNKALLVFAAH